MYLSVRGDGFGEWSVPGSQRPGLSWVPRNRGRCSPRCAPPVSVSPPQMRKGELGRVLWGRPEERSEMGLPWRTQEVRGLAGIMALGSNAENLGSVTFSSVDLSKAPSMVNT